MTYPEALKNLESFVNYEKLDSYDYKKFFKLDRMRSLASLLGDPQKDTKSIHVAGTKGKGSTAAIIHSILKNANFRAGLYTSPHLVSFRERIKINDELISENDICSLLEKVRYAIDGIGDDMPSFFEVYTALAYLYFKEKNVDFAVYEVGLGGRLDATNIIDPLVSAITPISYEHTEKLGKTLREIASEKAGIIKPDSICVSAPQEAEALETIEKACGQRRAKLILVGKDIIFKEVKCDDGRTVFDVRGIFAKMYENLETGLLGPHQIVNAATAIGSAEALRLRGIAISPDAIRHGVKEARWAGRLEVLRREPLVVLDGAQNRASAKVLADATNKIFDYERLLLVLGVSKDKDISGILDELLPISDGVILTKSKVKERALEPIKIREAIISKNNKEFGMNSDKLDLTSNVDEAISLALSKARSRDLILITGSLFVVGEARELIVTKNTCESGHQVIRESGCR